MIGVGCAGRAIAIDDAAMMVAIPMIGEIRINFIQLTSLFAVAVTHVRLRPDLEYPCETRDMGCGQRVRWVAR